MNTVKKTVDAILKYVRDNDLAPDEAGRTLPFPVIRDRQTTIVIAFYYCKRSPQEASGVFFPFLRADMALASSKITTTELDPEDFGLIVARGEPIGDFTDIAPRTVDEYFDLRNRYYSLLTTVIDNAWLLAGPPTTAEQKKVAAEIHEVLPKITEHALEPYYTLVARDLREWIKQAKNS